MKKIIFLLIASLILYPISAIANPNSYGDMADSKDYRDRIIKLAVYLCFQYKIGNDIADTDNQNRYNEVALWVDKYFPNKVKRFQQDVRLSMFTCMETISQIEK